MKEAKGIGDLPQECPDCNEKIEWIWGERDLLDDCYVQEATCPNCKTEFEEVWTVTTWNKKQKED